MKKNSTKNINTKKRKKIPFIIGGVVVAVVIIFVSVGGGAAQQASAPAIEVVPVTTGDISELVDSSGTVESRKKKVFFSPVNATVNGLTFQMGDTVNSGDSLITFDLENLEKDNKKAELSVKSTQYGYKDSINKSNKAAVDKNEAAANVQTLQAQVDEWKQYVEDLNRQIALVTKQAQENALQAQKDAAAAAQSEAQAQKEAAQAEVTKQIGQLQDKIKELNTKKAEYSAKLQTAQQELAKLTQELTDARSQQELLQQNYDEAANIGEPAAIETSSQALKEQMKVVNQLENKKVPEAQTKVDTLTQTITEKFDNPIAEYQKQIESLSSPQAGTAGLGSDTTGTGDLGNNISSDADTTELTLELQNAQGTLAELQSDLASNKAIAEADGTSLSDEAKAQMEANNNLQELESQSVQELINKGKKGIKAEFTGVISDSKVVLGGTVAQGSEMFTLQSTQEVDVNISLSKFDFEKVKEGQKAVATIGGKEYQGTVRKISHIAVPNEKGTPVIKASVGIDKPDNDIFLGVEAKVSIQAAEAKQVPIVPVEAINVGNDGSFCYVLKDGVITKQEITTGISSDSYTQVSSGLEVGDEVIPDIGTYQEGSTVAPAGVQNTGDTNKES